ncbi:pregnancy zone protein-like [Calliphora vicina]|uniref:pregnancy zone protein-like n=1 Tax=Calliphora vicina TaxID=7373 RepID=UPI00325A6F15
MMRSCIILLKLLLICNFLTFINCKGSYSINAPGTIQSNRKYTVSATLHNVSEPATFRIGIRSNLSWTQTELVELQPCETKMLDFYPPKLESDKLYELIAEGVKGLYFKSSTLIQVGPNKGVNIYIETDKGAYKPGDLLRFRVVILDVHGKPMNFIEPIKVQIFDASNNRVKLFKDIPLKKGVYTDAFQISKEPLLGTWSIKVFIGGKYAIEKEAKVEIEKYILPKFKVHIQTDENFVEGDRYMKINVFGKYTYNKYVQGKVNLTIEQPIYDGNLGSYTSDVVDFQAKFEIDCNEFYNLISKVLIVSASLIEEQTGIVQTTVTKIHLQTQRYKITIPFEEMEYRNEIPYRIKAKVQHWNGSIVNDRETSMFMQHGTTRYESKLDDNGMATFEYGFSENDGYTFSFKNSIGRMYNFIPYDYSFKPEEQSLHCNLKLKNKRPQVNTEIKIDVKSNQNIPYIVYTLTSHANIIKSEFVQLDSNTNSYTIQLMASKEMTPTSFLYVHYMVGGNMIYCETEIELPVVLENTLSIFAPSDVRPGEDITMTINAQPGSHVAIVAVDFSSLIYRSAYRINKNHLLYIMRSDVSYSLGGSRRNPGVISGLVTLTDGHYVRENDFMPIGVEKTGVAGLAESHPMSHDWSIADMRSYFPETWIYSDFEVTSAVTTINFKVPDSITTWVVDAFSINEKTGIGLLDSSVKITASKSFFINTYLPYSIKRGEIVSIPIVIFNYNPESLKTDVVMENSLDEFKFVDSMSNQTTNSLVEQRNIIVPANGGKSVNFLIYPQKLGNIEIRVKAKNKLATDGVLQKLTVEPDGLAIAHNHELYVSLKPEETFTNYYKTNIPADVEPDSEFLQLSISGDVLLPSLDNLDDLVNKPTGCGEQNMIRFAPNILVLEYLSATRQTSKYTKLVAKAKKFTEIGYQQQLKFRHKNGGYSVFGPGRSRKPSNWLTAYVVRFFIKALKYQPIEPQIIESSLSFLANQQLSHGEFANAGYVFHPAYQSSYGFTAFVLLSFLENKKYANQYQEIIQKALAFLSNNMDEINDIYSLAIMATTFQMAKHEHASVVLDKLKPLAKTENDLQWWEASTGDRVTNIEITSYILLALLHTPGQYLPIAKWLLEQRNSHGGFKSTQDTVVGLQALIKFFQFTAPQNDTLIKVSYRALGVQNEELENNVLGLEPDNAKIMQHQQLPPATRSIDIEISGTGSIFLQFSYNYRLSLIKRRIFNEATKELPKSFIVKTQAELAANSLTMNVTLSIVYTPLDDVKHLKTNMIVAEVNFPSGYIANEENVEEFRNSDYVDRVGDSQPDKVVLYFAYIEPNKEKTISLLADKKDDVRNLKPSTILVYEYYHSDRQVAVSYEIQHN